jgi:hypothetical protein
MDVLQQAPITLGPIRATLAAGTTTTLSNTGTMAYAIRSKGYSASAWSNTATPTTDINSGAAFTGVLRNKGCVYVVGLNAAGQMKVAQGTIEALDASGNFINAPQFPGLPNDFAPVGYIVIKAGVTADNTTGWVFGTSNMSSVTGITYTFVDAPALPDRPQVS